MGGFWNVSNLNDNLRTTLKTLSETAAVLALLGWGSLAQASPQPAPLDGALAANAAWTFPAPGPVGVAPDNFQYLLHTTGAGESQLRGHAGEARRAHTSNFSRYKALLWRRGLT